MKSVTFLLKYLKLNCHILIFLFLFSFPLFSYLDLFTNMGDIFRTTNGSTWQLVANTGYSDGASYIAVTNDTSYFLTATGIVLRSVDMGITWTPVASYSTSDAIDLIYNPSDGYYFMLTQSGDLYRGTSITTMNLLVNLGATGFVGIVRERLSTPGTAYYIAVTQDGDVYRSTDHGATWTRIANISVSDIVALTANVDTLHVLTYTGDLLRSVDRGLTWTAWSTISQVGAISLVADNQGILFLSLETGELAWFRSGSWHWLGTPSQSGVTGMVTSGTPTLTGEQGNGEVSQRIILYPNPGSGLFWLIAPQYIIGKRYEIYNRVGARLTEGKILATRMMLNLRSRSNGVYIFRAGNTTIKFVKD